MTKEERLMQIELKYMEKFERGEAPSMEELVETYPEMREELVEFVLNYVSLEAETDAKGEPSEDSLRAAEAARKSVLERVLAEPDSLVEARKVRGEKLGTMAAAVNLPADTLRALEKGVIIDESVPTKLLDRLERVLGFSSERLHELIAGAGSEFAAVHYRAQGAPKGDRKRVTFEEALRESPEFREDHARDWLSGDQEREG